jgi:hypothetical protein
MSGQASRAMRVMLGAGREYAAQAAERRTGSWPRALAAPALVALILGAATGAASTGRMTVGLLASGTLCWSFVPLLQMLTGAGLIASAPRRGVDLPRAVELLFAGHAPWSLWALAASVILTLPGLSSALVVLATAIGPAVWTGAILRAFCTTVLGTTPRGATWRIVGHQAATWTLVGLYIVGMIGGWARIVGEMGR